MSGAPVLDGKVWLRVNRVGRETCDLAAQATVADIHEAMHGAAGGGLMNPRMRPLVRSLRLAGPAVTASCPAGDNLMMHRALSLAEPGDVLVVVCQEERSAAQWGQLTTTYAIKRGLAGVVVQGCVRDVATVERLGFPVWATEIWPIHPEKKGGGFVNAPLRCGDVMVRPGDLVVADGDGVVVVPRADAAAVVGRAVERAALERRVAQAIDEGARLWELSGAAQVYTRLAHEEYDAAFPDEEPTAGGGRL
jgi:4-hydroxy-4-methyl-2-oxoglutarate aldolase